MPPSQLKRLKASLREQGIVGPQQSKKQKKSNAQDGVNQERRVRKATTLIGIREQFNPFEVKTSAKGPKFDITTNRTLGGRVSKGLKSRPGVTKGLGEENRRKTLLLELQRRNKVGGITDRRFGENDPTMAPEDKMLERFTQEKQRRHKNAAFDLEDEDYEGGLTHMGQSLSLDGPTIRDDFDKEDLSQEDKQLSGEEHEIRKRRRELHDGDEDGEQDDIETPERKKSKQEVMHEVIAKSKLHKYERQTAKDEDEDLREELDKELQNLHEILRGGASDAISPIKPDLDGMNPDRAALLSGADKAKLEKEYDLWLKQMAQDKRSKPTERTKTEEEKAAEESSKLQELERQRLLRMQGAVQATNDGDASEQEAAVEDEGLSDDFGLGSGIKARVPLAALGVEDEDEFIIDDDLVASELESESESDEDEPPHIQPEAHEDDEFFSGLLTEEEAKRPEFLTGANAPLPDLELPSSNGIKGDLAYMFACPQSHEELLEVFKNVAVADLPIVVQRIRALYHPKLNGENKIKLAKFAGSLVDHVSYLANGLGNEVLPTVETLIRHIHSLAKMYPVEVANAFRRHLREIHETRPLSPTVGDLILLTAIGTIFPTSDHFHQVVTPAMLSMARYLGQKIPQKLSDFATGTFLCTLCLQYQTLSKRYIPELVKFLMNNISVFSPKELSPMPGHFPRHLPKESVRIEEAVDATRLSLKDCIFRDMPKSEISSIKVALMEANLRLLDTALDTWVGKPAFTEVFEPAVRIMKHLESQSCLSKMPQSTRNIATRLCQKIQHALGLAKLARRPLELHHHRPLAIKMSIPKFEESFDPDKHYDPNRERAEAAKLRAQHKKEKKGAMRELRKDANFIARESLREKKERDAAHEKKMKRLIAEIQGEEGREAKAYEREKQWRKKSRK